MRQRQRLTEAEDFDLEFYFGDETEPYYNEDMNNKDKNFSM